VLTVSVAVPAVVPVIETGFVIEQVGVSEAVAVTAQASATLPVNPPPGVTLIGEVPIPPAEAIVIELPPPSVTVGVVVTAAFTVSETVVGAIVTPDAVPETVTV
jgi:hypothetical protein